MTSDQKIWEIPPPDDLPSYDEVTQNLGKSEHQVIEMQPTATAPPPPSSVNGSTVSPDSSERGSNERERIQRLLSECECTDRLKTIPF